MKRRAFVRSTLAAAAGVEGLARAERGLFSPRLRAKNVALPYCAGTAEPGRPRSLLPQPAYQAAS